MNHHLNYIKWKTLLAKYQKSAPGRSLWQLLSALVPYIVLWYFMVRTLKVSFWLTLPLALLAAGFLIRIFIIAHDCGHGSFLRSRRANHIVGTVTSFLVFIPYFHWRWQHALHHATTGNLDKRGLGDVWTMTVDEYLAAPRGTRISYRIARNPLIIFIIIPAFLFLVRERFPSQGAKKKELRSVTWTNVAALVGVVLMCLLLGIKAFVVIQFTVLAIAGSVGVWMFYIQHQFEGVYWARNFDWDLSAAALEGSSYYKLPMIAHWYTGNIGFHHIHHLNSKIPNYHLAKCQRAVSELQVVKPLTIRRSLKSLFYRLWDEKRGRLVGFRHLRTLGGEERKWLS